MKRSDLRWFCRSTPHAVPTKGISRFGSRLNMDYGDILKCKALTRKMDDLELLDENAPTM